MFAGAGAGEVVPQRVADASVVTGVGLSRAVNHRRKELWQLNAERSQARLRESVHVNFLLIYVSNIFICWLVSRIKLTATIKGKGK